MFLFFFCVFFLLSLTNHTHTIHFLSCFQLVAVHDFPWLQRLEHIAVTQQDSAAVGLSVKFRATSQDEPPRWTRKVFHIDADSQQCLYVEVDGPEFAAHASVEPITASFLDDALQDLRLEDVGLPDAAVLDTSLPEVDVDILASLADSPESETHECSLAALLLHGHAPNTNEGKQWQLNFVRNILLGHRIIKLEH